VSGFAVIATSDYLHEVVEGETLPSLDARLKAVCRDNFRRIDRFIALSVVGSGECAARTRLREDCAVYIGSGVGPVGSNAQVQRQMCRDHLLPKPFHFVNTLGSAAGHYVTKNLGLCGQSLFVSRRGAAFEAALEIAAADLELGVVSQALVGAVEECALPLAEHRRRQGLASEIRVAEGSHWILLEPEPRSGCATLRIASFAASSTYEADLPFHDSRAAALLTHWLEHRDSPRFSHGNLTAE